MKPWPQDIRLNKADKTLTVAFDDGATYTYAAEYLRVESPSAEVQGHTPDEKKLQSGKKDVAIIDLEPVGNYALKIAFDDLHDSGIYTWDYLHELGRDRDRIWGAYVKDLEKAGLSREA